MTQCVFNGTTTNHTYGSDGLRRRTVEGTDTTDYVLDGQSAVRTFLNASVDRTYLHGLRGPEYERIGANDPVWNLYDGLGSVLGTVDKNGTVVSTRKYDVYGAMRGQTGPGGTKHKYVGNLGHPSEDTTGLTYMNARSYDPVTGRFLSEDPAYNGPNWFAYCRNNPTTFVDADGRMEGLPSVMLGNALKGGLASAFGQVLYGLIYGKWPSAQDFLIRVGLGFVGGIILAPVTPALLARGAVAMGKDLLGFANTPHSGGLALIFAALVGLTFLARHEMRDDDEAPSPE